MEKKETILQKHIAKSEIYVPSFVRQYIYEAMEEYNQQTIKERDEEIRELKNKLDIAINANWIEE